MDQSGSSQSILSKVVIKDEIDIDYEEYDYGCGGSGDIKIKEESCSLVSVPDGYGRSNKCKLQEESYSSISRSNAEYCNSDVKEDDFVIDDCEKRCCVWLKENPMPMLLQEPSLPCLTLPEGTEIIKVKPVNHKKRLRFQRNEDINVSSRIRNEDINVSSRIRNEDINVSSSSKHIKKEKESIKDEFEAIRIIWESKLSKLEETQKVLAEDLINQILKKGFFRDLTPNTILKD